MVRILAEARKAWRRTPLDADKTYALAEMYAQVPGLELPALVLYRLYLATEPTDSRATEVRHAIERLEAAVERRILNYFALAKDAAAHLTPGQPKAIAYAVVAQNMLIVGATADALAVVYAPESWSGADDSPKGGFRMAIVKSAIEVGNLDVGRQVADTISYAGGRAVAYAALAAAEWDAGRSANAMPLLERAAALVAGNWRDSSLHLMDTSYVLSKSIVIRAEHGDLAGAKRLLASDQTKKLWSQNKFSGTDFAEAYAAVAAAQYKAGQRLSEQATLRQLMTMLRAPRIDKTALAVALHTIVAYLYRVGDKDSAAAFIRLADAEDLRGPSYGFAIDDIEAEMFAAAGDAQSAEARFIAAMKMNPAVVGGVGALARRIAKTLAGRGDSDTALSVLARAGEYGLRVTRTAFDVYRQSLELALLRGDERTVWELMAIVVMENPDPWVNRQPEEDLRAELATSKPEYIPQLLSIVAADLAIMLKEFRGTQTRWEERMARANPTALTPAPVDMRLGIEAARMGDWELAYLYLIKAARAAPGHPQPICNLAVAADGAGNLILAIAAYTGCLEVSPTAGDAPWRAERLKALAHEVGQRIDRGLSALGTTKTKRQPAHAARLTGAQIDRLRARWERLARLINTLQPPFLVIPSKRHPSERVDQLQRLAGRRDLIGSEPPHFRAPGGLSSTHANPGPATIEATLTFLEYMYGPSTEQKTQ